MADKNDNEVTEALWKISALAGQIPSSSSFASATLAREILEHTHRIQTIRVDSSSSEQQSSTSDQQSSKTQIVDLMEALKASLKSSAKPRKTAAKP
jgi:non-homologous end joining protein Ku